MRMLIVMALCIALLASGCINTSGKYDSFAKCLSSKGVVMYGSKDCLHCSAQKDAFEGAFQYVNYTECSVLNQPGVESPICAGAGIQAYPTWVFPDKTRNEGEMAFEDLSAKTGCQLPAS